MEYQNRLNTIPSDLVLTWWARQPAGKDYAHVVSMARTKGIHTTIPEARRHIQKVLKHRGLVPISRKPTHQDYQKAKEKWLDDWYGVNTTWLLS